MMPLEAAAAAGGYEIAHACEGGTRSRAQFPANKSALRTPAHDHKNKKGL
jgi:hypothetical protein